MRAFLTAVIAMIAMGCSDDAAVVSDGDHDAGGGAIEGLRNMNRPLPGIITAGQLTEAQFDACVDAGIKNFVNLRLADEKGTGWEEERAASAGVRYVRLPVNGKDGINLQNAQALDAALKASGGGETLVYCGSSNRVGALFGLRAHLIEGKPKDAAMTLAREAGATRYAKVLEELLAR